MSIGPSGSKQPLGSKLPGKMFFRGFRHPSGRYISAVLRIFFSMLEMDAFLTAEKGQGRRHGWRKRGESFTTQEDGVRITFFEMPKEWLGRPGRLEARMGKLYGKARERERCALHGERLLWLCAEVRAALGREAPYPGAGWAGWLLRRQGLCQRMTLILPDFGREDGWEELEAECRLAEEILGEAYEGLNGLLLVSAGLEGWKGSVELREKSPYFRHIYEETGLLTICTGELGAGLGPGGRAGNAAALHSASIRSHICMDLRPGYRIPFRALPAGTLYLDLTSDGGKARLLAAKRKDISYMSGRSYLDTYVRKRYNTTRYQHRCNTENG